MTRAETVAEERKNMAAFVAWAEHNKCVVQISYPRSGREWLYHLIEEITDKPTMRIFDTPKRQYEDYAYFYWHGHHYKEIMTTQAMRTIRFIQLVRDPRDCMISDAYRRVTADIDARMSRKVVLAARELLLDPERGYSIRMNTFGGRLFQYERLCLSPIAELQSILDWIEAEVRVPIDLAVKNNTRRKTNIIGENGKVEVHTTEKLFRTGIERYQNYCLKWKADPLFTDEDNEKICYILQNVLPGLGYTKDGHDLNKLELGLSTAGKWAIGKTLLAVIKELLPKGAKFLELGSGSGTAELAKFLKMTSIEHYSGWVDLYDSEYIHAPLVDGWYNVSKIREKLEKTHRYKGILIDGPNGSENRARFIEHMELFDMSGWIFFDDIHRKPEYETYIAMCNALKRNCGEYTDSDNKAFGVITPFGEKTRLEKVVRELNLVNYKPTEH